MSTYGDLYDHLEAHWGQQASKHSFQLVESLCQLHGIQSTRLYRMLRAWGANDDSEAIWNLRGRVPRDADVVAFNHTPAEGASRSGLYCRRVSAGWKPCERLDEGATLDISTAIDQMCQAGIAGE